MNHYVCNTVDLMSNVDKDKCKDVRNRYIKESIFKSIDKLALLSLTGILSIVSNILLVVYFTFTKLDNVNVIQYSTIATTIATIICLYLSLRNIALGVSVIDKYLIIGDTFTRTFIIPIKAVQQAEVFSKENVVKLYGVNNSLICSLDLFNEEYEKLFLIFKNNKIRVKLAEGTKCFYCRPVKSGYNNWLFLSCVSLILIIPTFIFSLRVMLYSIAVIVCLLFMCIMSYIEFKTNYVKVEGNMVTIKHFKEFYEYNYNSLEVKYKPDVNNYITCDLRVKDGRSLIDLDDTWKNIDKLNDYFKKKGLV